MDIASSIFLSLRGFSSESFGKTLTDGEITRKLRKGAFKNRSCPIFYVKPCSQQWGAAQRGMMQWFADFSSDIHFCRLWQACSEGEFDEPIANSLQNLLITLDQELTILERKYEQRFAGDSHTVKRTDFSVLRLYQKFRIYSPLFTSILRMVETAVSDRKFRRKLRRAKKPASHAYFGMIGIQSEFDLLQRKSYLAVDESGNLIQPAQYVRYGQLAFNKRQLSLRMHFRNPQVPLFSLFLKNVYSSWLQFTLSSAFLCTTKRHAGGMKEDDHILEGAAKLISSWTPQKMVLWAIVILLEYCKVDFDVLARFDNAAVQLDTKAEQYKTTELATVFDTLNQPHVVRFLASGRMAPSDYPTIDNGTAVFSDQHALVIRAEQVQKSRDETLAKLSGLLRFVVQQQRHHQQRLAAKLSGDSSERLWKHSMDAHPTFVFEKLVALFDEVNSLQELAIADPPAATTAAPIVVQGAQGHVSFVHFTESIRRNIFSPLCEHLRFIKATAYRIFDHDLHLSRQLEFIRNAFLLGRMDILQPFRDLILLLPSFVTSPGSSSGSTTTRERDASHIYQSQSQWQSLSFVLETTLLDMKPPKGIQHFSVYAPTILEAQRHTKLTSREPSSRSFHGEAFDERMLGYLTQQLKLEIHYQWPVAMLFPTSYIQRLQKVYQSLLSMMTLKWLSEAWWKAIIPKGGLNRYRVARSTTANGTDKHQQPPRPSRPPRHSMKVMMAKETHASEEDGPNDDDVQLQQVQRNCQQAFIQVMHLVQLLSGFYLSRIHERIWPEVIRKCGPSTSTTTHEGKDEKEIPCTIETVQTALRDGLELIEDLLSIIDEPLTHLIQCCLKAFQELRAAISVERSFPDIATGVKTQTKGRATVQNDVERDDQAQDEAVSRMLVAYRMAEIAFEDVNQAREALMLAILAWRATKVASSSSSQAGSVNGSAMKRTKRGLAKTPQSAWKMQQIQREATSWSSKRRFGKRLFTDESTMNVSLHEDSDNDSIDADDLQRAYSIDFLRYVEELQTQCGLLWTE